MDDAAPGPVRLLMVCGSLQSRSSNRAALDVAAEVATASGAEVEPFDRLAELPAFDPDRSDQPDDVVAEWRVEVDRADVVLVAAPEYAGGLAGAVKNALDWLVASSSVYRTPVAVISAGTTGGQHALEEMARTLTWQGAYVVAALGIAAPRSKSDEKGRFTDDPTLEAIRTVTEELLGAATAAAPEVVATATRVVEGIGIDAGHVAPPA
jgi:chromate reductase, NAD(P)H dehydrogenase (quinone)